MQAVTVPIILLLKSLSFLLIYYYDSRGQYYYMKCTSWLKWDNKQQPTFNFQLTVIKTDI